MGVALQAVLSMIGGGERGGQGAGRKRTVGTRALQTGSPRLRSSNPLPALSFILFAFSSGVKSGESREQIAGRFCRVLEVPRCKIIVVVEQRNQPIHQLHHSESGHESTQEVR